MKKVLILTCSTGEGHNSAAHALETAFESRGIACELADPVSFQSERMKRAVSSLYNRTIKKAPKVFGAVYKLGDIYCSAKLPSPVYWANAHYSEALQEYILEQAFDAVICTHLYGMEAMTAIRRKAEFTVPCYGVLTDYVCIPFLEETNLTGYFVPQAETADYLADKGIGRDRIFITGIPVDAKFTNHPSREQARKTLEIDPERKLFLLMTGGVGCENMESLCEKLAASLRSDGLLYVLTGRNEKLRARLDERYASDTRIKAIPFTKLVNVYMAAADVLLSKPGGLSSTEAAVSNVPQVHIHAIPGCETYNARYFSKTGMAFHAKSEQEAVNFATTLAYRPDLAAGMREMQRKHIHPDAAQAIVQKVIDS